MNGSVGILNVGAGDTKLSFDPGNLVERIRAARIVKDMLRRGYVLLVRKDDGTHVRALDFDESTCEYIIADLDTTTESENPHAQVKGPTEPASASSGAEAGTSAAPVVDANPAQPRRGRPRKRVAAESASAVAVARTAGG